MRVELTGNFSNDHKLSKPFNPVKWYVENMLVALNAYNKVSFTKYLFDCFDKLIDTLPTAARSSDSLFHPNGPFLSLSGRDKIFANLSIGQYLFSGRTDGIYYTHRTCLRELNILENSFNFGYPTFPSEKLEYYLAGEPPSSHSLTLLLLDNPDNPDK